MATTSTWIFYAIFTVQYRRICVIFNNENLVLLGPDGRVSSIHRENITRSCSHKTRYITCKSCDIRDDWQHCNIGEGFIFSELLRIQFGTELRKANICSIAVVGHSLVPKTVNLDIANMMLDTYRFPGATIDSLNHHLDQSNFWNKTYNLVILCIGGNDLTSDNVSEVFDKFCNLGDCWHRWQN